MYADRITDRCGEAIDETERRRSRQIAYNEEHGIEPERVRKAVYQLQIEQKENEVDAVELMAGAGMPRADLLAMVRDLEKEMRRLSKELQFEDAARVRDRIIAIRRRLAGDAGEAEADDEVALAIAAAPHARPQQRNWRRSRRGP